jgi:hypothetical protein
MPILQKNLYLEILVTIIEYIVSNHFIKTYFVIIKL